MARQPQPLRIHLKQTAGPLADLLHRLSKQQASLQLILAMLPEEFRPHCLHAELRQNEALILVDSPVWANRTRYLSPTILDKLNRECQATVKRIRIQIAPQELHRSAAPKRRRPTLSRRSAEVLQGAAALVTDPALSAALRRLARNRSDPTD